MEDEVDKLFKFKVGGTVKHVASNIRSEKGGTAVFFIVERLLQQCPGGIQIHYDGRHIFEDGGVSIRVIRVNEIELEEYNPEDMDSDSEMIMKFELMKLRAKDRARRRHKKEVEEREEEEKDQE